MIRALLEERTEPARPGLEVPWVVTLNRREWSIASTGPTLVAVAGRHGDWRESAHTPNVAPIWHRQPALWHGWPECWDVLGELPTRRPCGCDRGEEKGAPDPAVLCQLCEGQGERIDLFDRQLEIRLLTAAQGPAFGSVVVFRGLTRWATEILKQSGAPILAGIGPSPTAYHRSGKVVTGGHVFWLRTQDGDRVVVIQRALPLEDQEAELVRVGVGHG